MIIFRHVIKQWLHWPTIDSMSIHDNMNVKIQNWMHRKENFRSTVSGRYILSLSIHIGFEAIAGIVLLKSDGIVIVNLSWYH